MKRSGTDQGGCSGSFCLGQEEVGAVVCCVYVCMYVCRWFGLVRFEERGRGVSSLLFLCVWGRGGV